MAATAWTFPKHMKKNLGLGLIVFSAGVHWRMALFLSTALISAAMATSTIGSLTNPVVSGNGYTALGGTKGLLTQTWLSGSSAGQWRFSFSSPRVFNASGGSISNVSFAVIYCSAGSAALKKTLCYSKLSTANFTVTTGNTLTITASGTGVFNLA